jgi:hypothetical protein
MRAIICWPFAIACLGIMGHSAFAAPQTSIAELLMQGYEVKGTAYVPLQDAQSANAKIPQGQMLITLQKAQSIAVCQFNWAGWAGLASAGTASFTATNLCDVP